MANNCLFDARITGKKENVKELIDIMVDTYGPWRIFSCYAQEEDVISGDIIRVDLYGDCAWSVLTSMRNYAGRTPSLESETERLNLVIEIYSSEPGCQFQEHCLIDKGNILIDECVDYEEHWVSGYASLDEYNKENETNFTEDMIDENGDIKIGGFGDQYGCYEYFGKEHFE